MTFFSEGYNFLSIEGYSTLIGYYGVTLVVRGQEDPVLDENYSTGLE